jgi:hypothetical protein
MLDIRINKRIAYLRALLLVSVLLAIIIVLLCRFIRDSRATYSGHGTSHWREWIICDSQKGPYDFGRGDGFELSEDDLAADELLWSGQPDGVPVLLELTQDADPHIRAVAVRALGKGKVWNIRVVVVLRKMTTDEDLLVRSCAAEAMHEINMRRHGGYGALVP